MEYSRKIEFGSLYEVYEVHQRCCGLCIISKSGEEKHLVSVLNGELLIRPDIREELISGQFCPKHLEQLYAVRDKLGLALLLSSYLEQHGSSKTLAGRGLILNRLRGVRRSECGICAYVKNNDRETTEKLLLLIGADQTFVRLFQENFFLLCHRHYSVILASAPKLKGPGREGIRQVVRLQRESLEKIQRDLKWFIQKFNYNNQEAPWYDSRDSLKRVIEYFK